MAWHLEKRFPQLDGCHGWLPSRVIEGSVVASLGRFRMAGKAIVRISFVGLKIFGDKLVNHLLGIVGAS